MGPENSSFFLNSYYSYVCEVPDCVEIITQTILSKPDLVLPVWHCIPTSWSPGRGLAVNPNITIRLQLYRTKPIKILTYTALYGNILHFTTSTAIIFQVLLLLQYCNSRVWLERLYR